MDILSTNKGECLIISLRTVHVLLKLYVECIASDRNNFKEINSVDETAL